MFPGLSEPNPGLKLANAFSVTGQEFPHSLYGSVSDTKEGRRSVLLPVQFHQAEVLLTLAVRLDRLAP
jgi:hypothetical protein